jgi:large subunit ribosomal protein L25
MKKIKYDNIYSKLLNITIDDNVEQVVIKSIQRHQYKNKILHIDFQRVTNDSKVSTKIPFKFENLKKCIGVKYGGRINIKMVNVEIVCKAKSIPEYIEIDLEKLDIEDHIFLSDINAGANIEFSDLKKGFNKAVVNVKKPKKVTTEKADSSKEDDEKVDNKETNDKK